MATQPPTYRFFQSALIDPALLAISPIPSPHPKVQQLDIPHHEPPPKAAHRIPSSSIKVDVGSDPSNQRTWYLRPDLLSKHSTHLYTMCSGSTISSIKLPSIDPSTFQNFVDYMHSSIYSLHKHASSYHPIASHAQSWVLGAKMEVLEYCTAALRCLYDEVEPLARRPISRAYQSPIRAVDIQYVCENSEPESALRCLLFDAVASHWAQAEVLNIGYNMDTGPSAVSDVDPPSLEETSWLAVYNTYPDFRARLAESLKTNDVFRSELLRPMEDYVNGKIKLEDGEGGVDVADSAERGRRRKRAGLLVRGTRDDNMDAVGGGGRGRRSTSTESVLRGRSEWNEDWEDFMSLDDA